MFEYLPHELEPEERLPREYKKQISAKALGILKTIRVKSKSNGDL